MSDPFRLTPPTISEDDVERGCLDYLRYRGYYVVRLHSGVFRTLDGRRIVRVGEPGIPDYAALHECHPAFFLETKRPRAKLTPQQERKQWELQVAYHIASATIASPEALAKWLGQHEAKTT